MTIGDRVKFETNGGWYNSGIIISIDEKTCLVEVDTLGHDDSIPLPYYVRGPRDLFIAELEARTNTLEQYLAPSPDLSFYKRKEEHEVESKDESIKLVSYDKCKDCEHYGVWSQRCWNVYECPKDTADYIPYSVTGPTHHVPHYKPGCRCNAIEKEVKIDAENESLSEAEREKILSKLSYIKRKCAYDFVNGSGYTRKCISEAADEIERIIC